MTCQWMAFGAYSAARGDLHHLFPALVALTMYAHLVTHSPLTMSCLIVTAMTRRWRLRLLVWWTFAATLNKSTGKENVVLKITAEARDARMGEVTAAVSDVLRPFASPCARLSRRTSV